MYERIRERAARGDYDLRMPMDGKILGHLNDEGTMFAGAYQLGHTVKQLDRDLFDGMLGSGKIFPRMNSMIAQGLVVSFYVPGTSGTYTYQRTLKGKHVYEEWSNPNGTSPQDSAE
jgi:hypothetical protein